ncbi:MAG: hypothetical protein GEU99_12550 [Luteitalea sp.]|nr:hypothetical protein [Luteitalea sp.]
MNRDTLRRIAERTMTWNFRLWGFGEAIALRGLLTFADVANDTAARAFVHGLLRAWLGRGVAPTAADHAAPGRELLAFWRRTGDAAFLVAARALAALHASFPQHASGARWHRPDQPGWRHQIWVDCMDVDPPFLVQLAVVTGEEGYCDQGAGELLAYARLLQDDRTGLFLHGHELHCGRNGERWARGNGWALMGLVDTLVELPSEHPSRPELRHRLHVLCNGLAKAQRPDGLWHTVIDDEGTSAESTLAAMAAYALPRAFRFGLLDGATHEPMERRARAAIPGLIDQTGALQLVTEATPIGTRAMYATRAFGVYPWGQGPALLALSEP